MRSYITSFYEITLEPETFLRLTDKLISFCGSSVNWRRDVSGADTVILRDAKDASKLERKRKELSDDLRYIETPLFGDIYEQDDRLEYEPENFWGIYRRMADEFLRVFGPVNLQSLPFRHPRDLEGFGVDVWSSFFEREACHIIEYCKDFAVLVMRSVSYPKEYLETMNEIDEILIRRYHVDSR